MKPDDYRECCIVVQNTPYQVEDREYKETHAEGGVLQIGRVVWVKHRHPQGADIRVAGYAEGMGFISVESYFLRPS